MLKQLEVSEMSLQRVLGASHLSQAVRASVPVWALVAWALFAVTLTSRPVSCSRYSNRMSKQFRRTEHDTWPSTRFVHVVTNQ